MIKCKICGTENTEDFKFCMKCGAPLHEEDVTQTTNETLNQNSLHEEDTTQTTTETFNQNPTQVPKKGFPTKLVIIVAAALVLVAGVVTAIMLLGNNKSKSDAFIGALNPPTIYYKGSEIYTISDGVNTDKAEISFNEVRYSLDQSTVLVFESTEDGLYLYNGGTIDLVSTGVESAKLNYDGSKIAYTTETGLYIYDAKTATSTQITDTYTDDFAISADGNYISYINQNSEIDLFDGNAVSNIPVPVIPSQMVAVNNDKEIFFTTDDDILCVSDAKGNITKIVNDPSIVYLNRDYSECAILGNEVITIYKDGQLNEFNQAEVTSEETGTIETMIYPRIMNYDYDSSGYVTVICDNVDTHVDKYYLTSNNRIVKVDNKFNATEVIGVEVGDYVISADGSTIFYEDVNNSIYKYDGKNNTCLVENTSSLLECDTDGTGVYYMTNDNQLGYANGKDANVTLGEYEPYADVVNHDNYYIFIDTNSDLYSTSCGSEVTLLKEKGSSSMSYILQYGISYLNYDDSIFYIKDKCDLLETTLLTD